MPPAKRFFADGQENNGRGKRTVNRPAEVAMGRKGSYTARPDGNAARHTDARSLAIPVPRGTMIPTAMPTGTSLSGVASTHRSAPAARNRLRRTTDRVYAAVHRPRTFFQCLPDDARRVPKPVEARSRLLWRLIQRLAGDPLGRVHGRIDRVEWHSGGGRAEKTTGGSGQDRRETVRRPETASEACVGAYRKSLPDLQRNLGNLGMFGKPRKFLLPAPTPTSQPPA